MAKIKIFEVNNVEYKIDSSSKYPRIIDTNTNKVPKNQKGVCREWLKLKGYDLPADAITFNTHTAIELVCKILNNDELTEKEKSIRII